MAMNVALASAGLQVRPLVYWHGWLSVLNRCTEPRKRKITTEKIAVKAARYLYCVKRNELAPGHKMNLAKKNLRHELYRKAKIFGTLFQIEQLTARRIEILFLVPN